MGFLPCRSRRRGKELALVKMVARGLKGHLSDLQGSNEETEPDSLQWHQMIQ